MFADRKARAVGDVVTILIAENSVAVQDADAEASRSLDASARGGSGLFGIFRIVPRARLGGSTSQKGSGSTARSARFTATITCRVVGVTPNGLLTLQGERVLRVNEDAQTIQFSGLARPDDVAADNTILSSSVADARIAVLGKGPIQRHVKPGILSRIFEFLF
jgi:flagellar L-ring protein precursor FlgH